jgi:hypothetical protein
MGRNLLAGVQIVNCYSNTFFLLWHSLMISFLGRKNIDIFLPLYLTISNPREGGQILYTKVTRSDYDRGFSPWVNGAKIRAVWDGSRPGKAVGIHPGTPTQAGSLCYTNFTERETMSQKSTC